MIFGFTPFYVSGIDQKGLFKRIVRGKWSIPNEHNKVTRSAIEFIWGLLQRRPSERLGCLAGGYRDIKRHAWFQEVNFGKLIKKQIQVRLSMILPFFLLQLFSKIPSSTTI